MQEFIFSGELVSALYTQLGSDTLFVSFNGGMLQDEGYVPTPEDRCKFGLKRFTKKGYDSICIGNQRSDRYQHDETNSLLEIIKDVIKEGNYESVISYGVSLGGFAALAFSEVIGADKVLAFSPQILLYKDYFYSQVRERRGLKDLFSVKDGLSKTADIFVYYGGDPQDTEAAESDLVAICEELGIDKLHLVRVPYDTHGITLVMQPTGELEQANEYVLNYTGNNV